VKKNSDSCSWPGIEYGSGRGLDKSDVGMM